ncbi:MAG TPA: 4Fe-4S binding protein [Clostridiales bacterium]|nr:4Fe-4S binding protein [Clostridiales bacterium]
MMINKVWAVYFSATGTTEKIVTKIAKTVAQKLGIEYGTRDFTLPVSRAENLKFNANDLVIFGTPVYAGRVPNLMLKYLATIEGNDAIGVPVVLYGNRNYDDALIELRDILEKGKIHTIAAAAFIGEHSFSYTLAKDRPDADDMKLAAEFAEKIADKVKSIEGTIPEKPVDVKGIPEPYRGYYQPRDRTGNHIDIRKVKPLTNDDCIDCLICAEVCPMGAISFENVREVVGICIKCGACIKKCPVQAKYYADEGYLYHKQELEEEYTRRAEPEFFI